MPRETVFLLDDMAAEMLAVSIQMDKNSIARQLQHNQNTKVVEHIKAEQVEHSTLFTMVTLRTYYRRQG